jgi:hypothetical protein
MESRVQARQHESKHAPSVNAALQDMIVHAEEVHACKHDKAIAHKHAVETVAPPEIFGARCVQA